MHISDTELLQAIDAAVKSAVFDRSQVQDLDDILRNLAAPRIGSDAKYLDSLIDERIKRCQLTMNQIDGLHTAIDGCLGVTDHIVEIIPSAKGSYIPQRVLTIKIPVGSVSLLRVHAIGYDVNTGDTYSTTIDATVKNFNHVVSVVNDVKRDQPSADIAVSNWRVILVPDSSKQGITVLVQSDSSKRVAWKIVADVI